LNTPLFDIRFHKNSLFFPWIDELSLKEQNNLKKCSFRDQLELWLLEKQELRNNQRFRTVKAVVTPNSAGFFTDPSDINEKGDEDKQKNQDLQKRGRDEQNPNSQTPSKKPRFNNYFG